jgi:hypothetical protein
MDMTQAFRDTLALAEGRGMADLMANDPSLQFGHLQNMLETIEAEGIEGEKLGRWLGWAQAAVVAAGLATLDEMKDINVRNSVKPKLELDPYPWVTEIGTRGSKYLEKYKHIIRFEPREGYEQNRANYPESVR